MIDSPRSISEDLPPPTTPLPQKILIFREIELSRSSIEKFLIFSYFLFQEIETPKNVPYISGNGNRKNLLIFWEIKPLSPRLKKSKKSPPRLTKKKKGKKILILLEKGTLRNFLYFLKRMFFLYFGKRKWNFLIFQKVTLRVRKNVLYSEKWNCLSPKK